MKKILAMAAALVLLGAGCWSAAPDQELPPAEQTPSDNNEVIVEPPVEDPPLDGEKEGMEDEDAVLPPEEPEVESDDNEEDVPPPIE